MVQLWEWWDELKSLGPQFGYFANASKTWLVYKEEHLPLTQTIFQDTDISQGKPHLGAAIGDRSFFESYVKEKVGIWVDEIEWLSNIARSQPHAAYSALTRGLISKWNYLARTIPDISHLFEPLENAIHHRLIPVLTGLDAPNSIVRSLLALPAHLGGLGIINPITRASDQHKASTAISAPLVNNIVDQVHEYSYETMLSQMELKNNVKTMPSMGIHHVFSLQRQTQFSTRQNALFSEVSCGWYCMYTKCIT